MTHQTEISNPVPFSPFPADKKKDMQVKIKDFAEDSKGNIISYNMNTPECFDKGEVIEIPQNEFPQNIYTFVSLMEYREADRIYRVQYMITNIKMMRGCIIVG